MKRPQWIKTRVDDVSTILETEALLRELSVHTVCEEAQCPNRCECFGNKTATFMIMGDTCTRNCTFCAVGKGTPSQLDGSEPMQIADACQKLGLEHVVITSVTRDDLPYGGAEHFSQTIQAIHQLNPSISIEVLIPDLQGDFDALKHILQAKPNVLNHNIETVSSLYDRVRPMADYHRSLYILSASKLIAPDILTKSGIMVGLGESESQVYKTIRDLRAINCDILTIGQYLQPSDNHYPIKEYITPEQFDRYRKYAEDLGFKFVASAPMVRSSYHAQAGYQNIAD